jgi:single-strand DNA-binding protein
MLTLQIIGHLGQDASIKHFGEKKYIAFSVAHSESYLKDGVKVEKTQWVSCLKYVNGETKLTDFLKKGTQVYLEGDLSTKIFDNKGTPEVSVNCNVSKLVLVGGKTESSPATQSQSPANQTVYPEPSQTPTAQATGQGVPAATQGEDDLPF